VDETRQGTLAAGGAGRGAPHPVPT
jgi:hypothetical protein